MDMQSADEKYLHQHQPTFIVKRLAPFLTEQRKQRIDSCLQHKIGDIHLAVEQTADLHNALACVRSAEALGIVHVHFIAPEGSANTIRPLTQGAHHWIRIHSYQHVDDFFRHMQQQSIHCAGACIDGPLALQELNINQPLCLLLGNEKRGLSASAQLQCDSRYHIPMHGMTESFNLSVAAAISLYDTCSRKRQQINSAGNLSDDESLDLQARYYLHSSDERLKKNILNETR